MKKNSFVEGAIIATIAIILSKIFGILYVIPFYKIIGTKGGALYGYAYNIYNLFLIISSAGIPLAVSKLTSEYETKKEYDKKNAMYEIAKKYIRIFSIMSFVICFIFAKPLAHAILGDLKGGNTIEDVTFVIRCVSFALLVVPLLSISRGYLQGHKYISPSSISQVIEQFVRITVILVGSYTAINILKIKLVYAVGISVFSAAIGAIAGYLYLFIKQKKANINDKTAIKKIKEQDKKEIVKKLIGYSIPFIVINIANALYNNTDMILVIRTLKHVGYNAAAVEEISSVFTTWGSKLLNIVKAFATGLTISLIPTLVSKYISNDKTGTNEIFNTALKIILYIVIPIPIFMSIFSNNIWNIFYGQSTYGPLVFRFYILVSMFDCFYILINSTLQAMYKTKLIYISVLIGLLINIMLDVPVMLLLNKLGINAFYGASIATMIGYSISIIITLIYLKKIDNFTYKDTFKNIPRLLLTLSIYILICLAYKKLMPSPIGFIKNSIYVGIIGIISVGVYYLLNQKIINKMLKEKKK